MVNNSARLPFCPFYNLLNILFSNMLNSINHETTKPIILFGIYISIVCFNFPPNAKLSQIYQKFDHLIQVHIKNALRATCILKFNASILKDYKCGTGIIHN